MILPVVLLVVIVSVPLLGGDLRRIGGLRIRGLWLAVMAMVAQTLVISVLAENLALGVAAALHVATYLATGLVVWWNRHLAGLPVIAAGGAANLAAIAANGGVMPAAPGALARAGLPAAEAGFSNSAAVADPRLAWLGDIWAIPASWPLSNVFSIGDVLLVLGAGVLLHHTCRSRLGGRRRAGVVDRNILV